MSRICHPGYSQYDHVQLPPELLLASDCVERVGKCIDENGLLAVRTSGDDSHLRPGFLLHKREIALGFCRQAIVLGDAVGLAMPSWKLGIDGFDLFVTRGLRWNLLGILAVDLVADADGDFRQ